MVLQFQNVVIPAGVAARCLGSWPSRETSHNNSQLLVLFEAMFPMSVLRLMQDELKKMSKMDGMSFPEYT